MFDPQVNLDGGLFDPHDPDPRATVPLPSDRHHLSCDE